MVVSAHSDTEVHGTVNILKCSATLDSWYLGHLSGWELALVLFKLGASVCFGSVVGSAATLEAKPFLGAAVPQHDFVFHGAPGRQR